MRRRKSRTEMRKRKKTMATPRSIPLMIFADVESKSRLKVINREVDMVAPVTTTTYLKWSQTAITFDQSDHPARVATPRRQALVVDQLLKALD